MNIKPEYRDDHKILLHENEGKGKSFEGRTRLFFSFMQLEFSLKGCFTSLFYC